MEKIRQLKDLTIDDLNEFPVWEIIDEGNEGAVNENTFLSPREDMEDCDPESGCFVVRTTFVASNGKTFTGYCVPSRNVDVDSIQPIILADGLRVNFWYGCLRPDERAMQDIYQKLKMDKRGLFPLNYATAVKVRGNELKGQIKAFTFSPGGESIELFT